MTAEPLLTIEGTVATAGPVAGTSVATVKLVDSTGEVLAATAVRGVDLPLAFAVHADPAMLTAQGYLLLWAALRTDDGLWGTPDLVPVTDSTATLVLTQIED
jgi:uncharacterized lipoprotein YbaY